MLYRRYPLGPRRYFFRYGGPNPGSSHNEDNKSSAPVKDPVKAPPETEHLRIPLPNEEDRRFRLDFSKRSKHGSSFLDGILGKINLDEVILLGVIYLMLDEGLDDDFMLVILIYLLFSGKDKKHHGRDR